MELFRVIFVMFIEFGICIGAVCIRIKIHCRVIYSNTVHILPRIRLIHHICQIRLSSKPEDIFTKNV